MQATPPFRLLVSLVSRLTQTQVYHRGRTKKKKEKKKQERVLYFLFSAEHKTNEESAHAHSTPP
jgi:hypothetical protein